jgi:hypothetical protein
MFHLVIPLVVGLGFEAAVIKYHSSFPGWWEFTKEKLSLIIGVFLTYVGLSCYLIYKETNIQVERSQLRDLEAELPTAESFFATCTLGLREWFEPSTQVYFARLLSKQIEDKQFRQQRVLLFFHNGEVKDSQSLFLDGHHANALVAMHKSLGIELAYLARLDILDILGELSIDEKKTIQCYPSWISWAPDVILNWYLRSRRTIPELDFAFITHRESRRPAVFPFSKRGESLKVERENSVLAYEHLMKLINNKIYEPNTVPPRLRARYEFSNKVEQL